MRSKFHFPSFCAGVTAGLLAVTSPGLRADSVTPVRLGDSIRSVAVAPPNGAMRLHRPYISRSALNASESAEPMTFEVALKMRNFAELQRRVNRGETISPAEMAEKYEPLASDYQAVAAWLKGEGFSVVHESSRHLALFARGKVSQIGQSLQVNFARVSLEGNEYTSAVTAPSVPANLAPLLIGINGLQPHIRAHQHLVKPNAANGSGGSYTPAQIAQAYQATGLYGSNINGAGQTIAIVIDTFPKQTDLITFWSVYGISQSISNITFKQVVAGQLGAPSGEETLDTEWSSAMAPGAKVRVYASLDLEPSDLDEVYQTILDDAATYGIHQMSMSYGLGELDAASGQIMTDHQDYFVELANAGVTCFASSGDEGAYPGTDANNNPELEAEAPASDPSVTGVGGTTLTTYANPTSSNETAWNNDIGATGGGASTIFDTATYCPWQAVNGVSLGAMRQVPDIACAADPEYGADVYLAGKATVLGGTSWASPTCAGFCALINQVRANAGLSSIGLLGPHIYPLIGTANFRDITTGPNPVSYYSFSPSPGYDEAAGIGVPLIQTLATSLAIPQTVTPSSVLATVNPGQNATFSVTASGSPISYQWQRMPLGSSTWTEISLSDTATFTGSSTASLTLLNPTAAMSGDQYQCVVTYDGAFTATSAPPTTLIVETPWSISTLAGDPGFSGLTDNTGAAARFDYPTGLVAGASGNLYVTDLDNKVIRKVTTPGGAVTTPTLSGAGGTTNTNGTNAIFSAPRDLAIDSSGNLYVADEGTNLILKITVSSGQVATFAGTTSTTSPIFNEPRGIAVDGSGNVYVADSGNNVIRKITPTGTVSTYAGTTSFIAGYKDGTGTVAQFNQPIGLAIDSSGNLYVADYGNAVVRKIVSNGVGVAPTVSTIAGQAGVAGCVDGAGTTQALFNTPRGVAVDGAGNVYVTDSSAPNESQNTPIYTGNNLVREISTAGIVTTLAGQGGIAGTASALGGAAQFYSPTGITVGSDGLLYLADSANNAIRVAMPSVLVTATVPLASAVAGQDGQFTVSRTGSTAASLAVNYSTSGSTATAGTDYHALTSPVTIPAGASSATLMVTPLSNSQATANRTVQLTLTGTVSGLTTDTAPATVTLIEAPAETFATWQANHPDPSTPLGDSVPDLAKYAFDIDPSAPMTNSERSALPASGMTTIGTTTYLTLTYREYAGLSGTTTVTPQLSTDLVNWSAAPAPEVIGIDSTTQDPILQIQVPVASGAKAFLRLNIAP